MADEYYEWLDKDAAEKLLRGEPVVPVGDRARDDALRLAEALGAARDGRRASGGALPGEDAVLAAFRQAAHGDGADRLAGRSAGSAVPGRPGMLHSVHIGPAPAPPARRPRWSRPVRFGLAVSLAGFTLGGVAVAAGTGVLAGSFGGQGSPAPATSVSAAATPEPLTSDRPAEDPSSPADPPPPDAPETSSSPATRQSAGSEKEPGGPSGGTGPERGGDRTGGRERPDNPGREEGSGGTPGGDGRPDRPDDASGNWYRKSVKACKAFHEGALDDRTRRQLIELAKGERNLERFCDRLLGGSGGSGGNGGGGGSGGSGGDGDQDGPGPGKGDGDGDSLPPVSFHPVPRSVTAPGPGDRIGANELVPLVPPTPPSSAATAAPTR
ncbi:hypothetical protein RI138_20915 [Streptomyces sp. C11-1]|uniref:Extensin n=1 Tax=Streptomyces durocortorensis TaxID=2811104 RepID=A0ABY9VZ72_9ACTN|nr:hypothetical protein [Streptomyces durocortorensis]WNF29088.1 hypothetical protein RI138_20915 [Streptomyces durocortorensis]